MILLYMKKATFIIIGLVLILSILVCSVLYITRNKFASPLPVKLVIRNDDYGGGYFGAKRSGGRRHKGIDLLADMGAPVLAAKFGIVQFAGHKKGNGKFIVLKHLWGYKTFYLHLSKIDVKQDQWVKQGQVIGYVGKTGNANRGGMQPHLHFEVHKDGIPQDPMQITKDLTLL